ncbi:MAG: hypothetical protein KAS66_08005 [Candidatus Omnitrophica bacterium]|nr:hypothetical protein [Candidatus Omnitrophota bacterium]
MKEFIFTDCVEIKELTGRKADDEMMLMELIENAPIDSIYYHMHSFFLRHFYIVGPYPNDFANWVVMQVRDRVLAEKLSAITPAKNKNLEDIRDELVEVIDAHLTTIKTNPSVIYGQPFYLMNSKIIEIPTRIEAKNLKEFRSALAVVDASAVYNHVFEARLRVRRGRSDFAIWFEEVLGLKNLADAVEHIDSYMYSLEGLRAEILSLCDKELKGPSKIGIFDEPRHFTLIGNDENDGGKNG